MFLFEKFDKNINLIRVSVGQVTFLSEDWKKLSVWSNVLFRVSTLEIVERKAYIKQIKQMGPNVSVFLNKISALEYDQFMQVLHSLLVICKYVSLSHKPAYQCSRSNIYQFVLLFQWFK